VTFEVVLDQEASRELEEVPVFHRRAIVEIMEKILTRDPTTERRSRIKRLRRGFFPPYRLRVGEYRVYYDVDESKSRVNVLHIWKKGRAPTPSGTQEE
jgi:mRNA interferase RelE/StbE